ncbi:MAG: metallophosphoesterase [Halodesulfurarchaeum sp.]
MLVVISDTHRTDRPGLTGSLQDAVRRADRVVHAGDFTTISVLEGFESVSRDLDAVHGNRDTPAVRERLPSTDTVDVAGIRIALTHTQRGGETGLRYFGEEQSADVVVSGHTHRPHMTEVGELTLLNPGSHAAPRGSTATYAVLEPTGDGLSGAIKSIDGRVVREFVVEGRN